MKKEKTFALSLIAAAFLLLLTACAAPKPSGSMLMEDVSGGSMYFDAPAFGSPTLTRAQVRSITFLSDASDAPADNWDVSQAQDGSAFAWAVENGELYDLFIAADGGLIAPENCNCLFAYYSNMESIDFNGAFDTSNVTTMRAMFWSCNNLKTLDVSGFDTSNVTEMVYMFHGCSNLTALDVSDFNTSKVTNMYGMFMYCRSLQTLNVSNLDTSNVTNMGAMFYNCNSLTALDVSGFDTSNVTDVNSMFGNCPGVTQEDISAWDLSNVTHIDLIFDGTDMPNFRTSVVGGR